MPTVCITAGAKNTGFAIAEKFAKEGFDVAFTARSREEIIAAEKSLSEKYKVKIKGYILELTDINNVRSVFAEIKKDFGGLDTFVANAANLGVNMNLLTVTEYSTRRDSRIPPARFRLADDRRHSTAAVGGERHWHSDIPAFQHRCGRQKSLCAQVPPENGQCKESYRVS